MKTDKIFFVYAFMVVIAFIFLFSLFIQTPKDKPYTKPFIIIETRNKSFYDDINVLSVEYFYQDANGRINVFRDSVGKYNIGDTIK